MDEQIHSREPAQRLAAAVRDACLEAAVEAFEQASVDGLCCIGAWDCALSAIQALPLDEIVRQHLEPSRTYP